MNEITTTSELQKITTGLESFEQRKAALVALAESAKEFDVKAISELEAFKQLKAKRIELKNARVLIEKEGKAMRDLITPISKHISAKEKELVAIVSSEEDRLQSREAWFEGEIEKIRLHKEAEEKAAIRARIDAFGAYGVAVDFSAIVAMTPEVFDLKLAAAKSDYEAEQKRIADEAARVAAEKKAEEERLEAQRKEQESERKRLAEIAAKQEAEAAALAAERKAIEDEKNRIAAEAKAKEDAEKQAKLLEEAKAAAAAQALKDAEEKAKREAEAKAEAERVAAEKEAKRIARMPDKKKLTDFAQSITGLVSPELKSVEADQILSNAVKALAKVSSDIIKQIENL